MRAQGNENYDHAELWPTEIRLSKDKRKPVTVAFEDGSSFDLPAEYLRVMSPSAEVQGHSAAERKTVPGKRDVEIMPSSRSGNYAVRLVFDDMHDTGSSAGSISTNSGAENTARAGRAIWRAGVKGTEPGSSRQATSLNEKRPA